MSSTKRTPAHPAYNLPEPAAAAAAVATAAEVATLVAAAAVATAAEVATLVAAAEAATPAAAEAVTVATDAEAAVEAAAVAAASGSGGAAAAAAAAEPVGYGPNGAGFGLANERGALADKRERSSCALLRTSNEWSKDMWKALIAGTAAGVIAGSSLLFAQQSPAPAAATPTGEQHDQDTGWQPSAEDDQDTGSAEDEQDSGWQNSCA